MNQYGATDFITIQPYPLQLPRDYPIRVLSYSLAFRIGRKEGRLLTYEEGKKRPANPGYWHPRTAVKKIKPQSTSGEASVDSALESFWK